MPKSAAVKDVDIVNIFYHKYRYCIDIGKGNVNLPPVQCICLPIEFVSTVGVCCEVHLYPPWRLCFCRCWFVWPVCVPGTVVKE